MQSLQEKATDPAIAPADRAARRSAWIGIISIGGGAIMGLVANNLAQSAALRTGHSVNKPSGVYLAIWIVMMIAAVFGTIDAVRAFRGGTARTGYAVVGLLLNGGLVVLMGVIVLIFAFGAMIWSGM